MTEFQMFRSVICWTCFLIITTSAEDVYRKFHTKSLQSGQIYDFEEPLDEFASGDAIIEDNNIFSQMMRATATRRACYLTTNSDLQPEMVDPNLCNILFVCSIVVTNSSTVVPGNDNDILVYPRIIALKQSNPELKILPMVVGPTEFISNMASSPETRTIFINSVLDLINVYGFDGVDIDWEFPAWNSGNPNDKQTLPLLLQETKAALDEFGTLNNKTMLLSLDVAAPKSIIDDAYDVPEIAKHVDFVNLMTYDFHFFIWYDPATGHNSPLFAQQNGTHYLSTLSTSWSANLWVSLGMPKYLINVGIPTYGHTYTLINPDNHGLVAPASGNGMFEGWITYPQVCTFLDSGGNEVFDTECQVPYGYKDSDWISYENIQSAAIKGAWIRDQGFGGVMIFNLNSDDFLALCDNSTTFPLHRTVFDAMNRNSNGRLDAMPV